MKVLAINSSPMMEKGNTALILDPFLTGMKEEGAEIEVLYTKRLKVNPCQGEFNCWFKKPGNCFQDDDVRLVRPKFGQADLWVLATPLYVDGMSGSMKNLLDRMIPLLEPSIELRDGHCRHPLREGVKAGQVVLVSTCGFPEMDNFDALLSHVKAACRNLNRKFAGAVLRPSGPILRVLVDMGAAPEDIFAAARDAGRQLVRDGVMAAGTLDVVGRELVPRDMFIEQANQHIRQLLKGLRE
jgi:multimeric flavodoxin WrbA